MSSKSKTPSSNAELSSAQRDNLMKYYPEAFQAKTASGKVIKDVTLQDIIENKPGVKELRKLFKRKVVEYTDEESFSD
jgi:propanediol dehydratase small subunit